MTTANSRIAEQAQAYI